MAKTKLDQVARKVGHAVGTLEVAAGAAGKRARQGVVEAAAAVGSTGRAEANQAPPAPAKKTVKKR